MTFIEISILIVLLAAAIWCFAYVWKVAMETQAANQPELEDIEWDEVDRLEQEHFSEEGF